MEETPSHYDSDVVQQFIDRNAAVKRRIVLITSGGTTVPLEKSNVRFIDNFSAGTRGSTSAEYFLEQGYAVIFMYRQFSLQPFTRAYSHAKSSFLDNLYTKEDGSIGIAEDYSISLKKSLKSVEAVREAGTLLKLHFTTITEYLSLLKSIAILLRPLSSSVLFYLAAAVSDFYVPQDLLPDHKIQSNGTNTLQLTLQKAPKVLQSLVEDGWAPRAFICSFKLETDPALLIRKARAALESYGHQCVVANILARRAAEVVLVTADEEAWLTLAPGAGEIERELVGRIVAMHTRWIAVQSPIAGSTPRTRSPVRQGSVE